MGVISACFGGIIRDVLGKEDSIIFSREIYVTAAVAAAATFVGLDAMGVARELSVGLALAAGRSEEHTSELQSLMRISYAVFCLKKKKPHNNNNPKIKHTTITEHKK